MPGEWHERRYGDSVELIRDVVSPQALQSGERYVGLEHIGQGTLGFVGIGYAREVESAKARFRRGDVLYGKLRPYFRKVAQASFEGVCSTDIWVLRPKRGIDPGFLFYLTAQPSFTECANRSSEGTRMPRAEWGFVSNQVFSIPPLPEQRAIARILGALDDKIDLNRRLNETLEAMARALFQSWFVDFDPVRAKAQGRDPGLPAHLAALFPDRLVESELGEVPQGWEVKALGDVAMHLRRGVQPEEIDPETPYIALEHMPKRCIALSEWGNADGVESNKFEFKRGEVLFGKLRPYFHKVGVAPVDGVCSTDIVVASPRTEAWFGFVLGHMSHAAFVDYTNASSTGTKMPRTSWDEMARYPVVLPSEGLANAFTMQIRPAVDRMISAIHESRTLAALRDVLLPKLLSGEVRVGDAERFVKDSVP